MERASEASVDGGGGASARCVKVQSGEAQNNRSHSGRRRGMPARAWGRCEAGVGCSCGTLLCARWRASYELGWCEPFDELHGSTAERAPRKSLELRCLGSPS